MADSDDQIIDLRPELEDKLMQRHSATPVTCQALQDDAGKSRASEIADLNTPRLKQIFASDHSHHHLQQIHESLLLQREYNDQCPVIIAALREEIKHITEQAMVIVHTCMKTCAHVSVSV